MNRADSTPWGSIKKKKKRKTVILPDSECHFTEYIH